MEFGTFLVKRAVIHQIPQARLDQKEATKPILSEVPSNLDTAKRTYFQKRIRRTLQQAFAVERDPEETGPVCDLVTAFFADPSTFVRASREMAQHLHLSQGGSSPGGLLAVVEGTVGVDPNRIRAIGILKLEMESGIHVEQTTVNGKSTFAVEVEDVTLTDRTRVFKLCAFAEPGGGQPLLGQASDDQLDSATVGREIAEYFLRRFLGCRLRTTASVATKRYLESAETYINSLAADGTKKLRYEAALLTELSNNVGTIKPEAFATTHLDVEDRDAFVDLFREPDGSVPTILKDIELVRRHVTRAWVEWTNGVRVTGPPDEVQKVVTAMESARDADGARIVDGEIRRVR